jgi:hypothetical protein
MRDTLTPEERLGLIYKVLNCTQHNLASPEVQKAGRDAAFELAAFGYHSIEWLQLVEKECKIDLKYWIGLVKYREDWRNS